MEEFKKRFTLQHSLSQHQNIEDQCDFNQQLLQQQNGKENMSSKKNSDKINNFPKIAKNSSTLNINSIIVKQCASTFKQKIELRPINGMKCSIFVSKSSNNQLDKKKINFEENKLKSQNCVSSDLKRLPQSIKNSPYYQFSQKQNFQSFSQSIIPSEKIPAMDSLNIMQTPPTTLKNEVTLSLREENIEDSVNPKPLCQIKVAQRYQNLNQIIIQNDNKKKSLVKQNLTNRIDNSDVYLTSSQNQIIPQQLSDSLIDVQIQQRPSLIPSIQSIDDQKLEFYYRFRMSSMLVHSGNPSYYQNDNNDILICIKQTNQFNNSNNVQKIKKGPYQQRQSVVEMKERLLKSVQMKSKYKHREKLDLLRAEILVNIGYDSKNGLQMAKLRRKTKKMDVAVSINQNNSIQISSVVQKQVNLKTANNSTALNSENDLTQWKKKHKIGQHQKVYIVSSSYRDIKSALDRRGWVENPDKKSLCFDLKFSVKAVDVEKLQLQEWQMINHFEKNTSITTKIGLTRNLRNLICMQHTDTDRFHPRSYDLFDKQDFEDFVEDFKFSKCEALLKSFNQQKLFFDLNQDSKQSLKQQQEYLFIIKLSLQISKRKWKECFTNMLLDISQLKFPYVAKNEWECILEYENNQCLNIPDKQFDEWERLLSDQINNVQELQQQVSDFLQFLKQRNPQYNLSGNRNIWIVKPSGMSRGRGIQCFDQLSHVINYIIGREKNNQWIAQKYLENQLIISDRKFDIRQWVLVTDWNPMKIYFYDECYIRFSAEDYNMDDISNKYIHLTNNSVGKNSKNFIENPKYQQNMMTMEQFRQYIDQIKEPGYFDDKIKTEFKKQVIQSLKSVKDMVGGRKNCFEHFGYDFLIDENFQVWLIEVNASPSMDYSTKITENLVKQCSEDLIKVVIDKRKDTGKFICIYKDNKSLI